MKATTETLSPTRVKLTVEVSFDELKPNFDAAYKSLAAQVKIPGFRNGKIPPQLLEQRVGRATVLDEAINDALPKFYSEAVEAEGLKPIGRPEVDITKLEDRDQLIFTAEVDVRPEVVLPELAGIPVTVDDVVVTDDEINGQIDILRERFGTLEGVERPVEHGDYVSVDLDASVAGEKVEGAQASGLSYEVGSGNLVPGLDEAIIGLSEGAAATFSTRLVAGEYADRDSEVAVTVRSVKVKHLPELDDDFAQTASEFDTIEELRTSVRERFARVKAMEQGMQARDRVLDALLEKIDIPLPEAVVESEVESRTEQLKEQLERAGLTREGWLESEEKTEEEWAADLRKGSEQSIKAQFVLDAIVEKEQIGVSEPELTDQIVRRAQQVGMDPQAYADAVVRSGQLQSLMSEVVRGKALAFVLEAAEITDASGNKVDLEALDEHDHAGHAADDHDHSDGGVYDHDHDHDAPDHVHAADGHHHH